LCVAISPVFLARIWVEGAPARAGSGLRRHNPSDHMHGCVGWTARATAAAHARGRVCGCVGWTARATAAAHARGRVCGCVGWTARATAAAHARGRVCGCVG